MRLSDAVMDAETLLSPIGEALPSSVWFSQAKSLVSYLSGLVTNRKAQSLAADLSDRIKAGGPTRFRLQMQEIVA